ncbi:hypothetical protein SISNIDRAFT_490470 [Sistotremastrum niveocremeum HHB9708]|uniref:F-box domain-containing protein n=1 Tax=Sistotremastrum niveocremeum HHB9708 TaxID=1314777 RepID=A0A164NWZ7_9AGAM|nr:hypothetical protein SISNIDRAFT_490470 [Sistotremastrum niveocremeum HHB9708]
MPPDTKRLCETPATIEPERELGGSHSPRTSATDQFWSIPELVALVMEFVFPSQNDLYSCSLVSKSISSIALDVLYGRGLDLWDFLPFLGPVEGVDSDDDPHSQFSNPPCQADWDLFYRYAVRAKSIALKNPSAELSKESVADFYLVKPPDLIPFPRLQSLSWQAESIFWMRCVNMCLHRNLTELIIRAPPITLRGVCESVANLSPNLRTLKVRFSVEDDVFALQVFHEFVPSLSLLNKLQFLEMPAFFLSAEVISILSAKTPNLSALLASGYRQSIEIDNPLETPKVSSSNYFPCLAQLSLEIGSLWHFPTSHLRAPFLQQLHIQMSFPTTKGALDHCISILVENCAVLSGLSIAFQDPTVPQTTIQGQSPITAQSLKDILKLPSLRYLEIDDIRPPDLDDNDLIGLAPRCSSLLTLNICIHARHPDTGRFPTLAPLISFARHCPELVNFGYCMDATKVPSSTSIDPPRFATLNTLDICDNTRIKDPYRVAAFLIGLVPPDAELLLEPVHCYRKTDGTDLYTEHDPSSNTLLWKMVEKMFVAFESLRTRAADKPEENEEGETSSSTANVPES